MRTAKFFSLGLVALAIFGLMLFAQQGQTQEKAVDHMKLDAIMQECAQACSDCQRACDLCATHCAQMLHEGKKEHLFTLATCRDCATVCAAAAQIVARGGPFAALICEACAKACDQCATACEAFPDDEHMKACAEECRRCEQACQEMLKHISSK
jgi:hypothetical protein